MQWVGWVMEGHETGAQGTDEVLSVSPNMDGYGLRFIWPDTQYQI